MRRPLPARHVGLGLSLAIASLVAACTLDRSGLGADAPADAATGDDAGRPIDGAPFEAEPLPDTAADDTGTPLSSDAAIDVAPEAEAEADAPDPTHGCTSATYGGHEYWVCERDGDWDAARDGCKALGQDLVVITDEAENAFVQSIVQGKSKDEFYIGLTDREKEGTFVWVDDTKAKWTNWDVGEPNDLFGEDCSIVKKSGKWNDVGCNRDLRNAFVCEQK